jgi:hypothetical protein
MDWKLIDTIPPLPLKPDGTPELVGDFIQITGGGLPGVATVGVARIRLAQGNDPTFNLTHLPKIGIFNTVLQVIGLPPNGGWKYWRPFDIPAN